LCRAVPALAAALALLCAPPWSSAGAAEAGGSLAADPFLEEGEQLPAGGEEGEGRFGTSLALSADGQTALVGAPGDNGLVGAVWAFTRQGTEWSQQGAKLTVPEEEGEGKLCASEPGECGLGAAVALSADGNTALVGAPRQHGEAGAVWVFTRSGATWTLSQQLTAGPEEKGKGRFGRGLALSADGDVALVGAPKDNGNNGAVWAFTRTGSAFAHEGPKMTGLQQTGEGYFGRSVALSADGNTALIGSPVDNGHIGAAWAFVNTGVKWNQAGGKITGAGEAGEGRFGFSVAISADGKTGLVGGRTDEGGAGAAWALTRGETGWTGQGAKLVPSDASGASGFGNSVALSADGNAALIGGPRDAATLGAAWVFIREGETWSQQGEKLVPGEAGASASFGASVALSANDASALIAAPHDAGNAGSAWSYIGTPLPAPAVSEVTPATGPAAGGTAITIKGSGFLPGATVTIGEPASSVKVLSETEITAVTPPHAAGSAPVVVSDLYGTSDGSQAFSYTGPPVPAPKGRKEESKTETPLIGVLAASTLGLPAPKLGVDGNLLPVSGLVKVKVPGSKHFVVVGTSIQVPFGTIIDATLGKVSVITAGTGDTTQAVSYYAGEFKITQAANGQTLATLLGGSFAGCPRTKHRGRRGHKTSADEARSHKPVRKLWAEGHGKYSTKGNYATGAALGTRWVTEDLCGGTLIRVLLHRVFVTNLVTHRHVTVTAGHSYLAKAP
jgi:hypothetical protein